MTLARGTQLGGYEIVAPLGAGGMGEVYRARDLRLDRDVAIKVLPPRLTDDPASLARFEREAKAVAALSHPGILSIFDFGSANGLSYAVTELLEGETLRSHVAAGSIPPRKAIDYAVQIADGLAAAHERGIVHRDLKPENLFLTTDGRVKILDFGLARQTGAAADDTSSPTLSHHTDPGTVLGTVGYMSPEQVRGQPAGPASDIFSFGAVFYEMLTGRRAFKGDSAAETMHAILKEEPPDLLETSQSLPPALERIVRHCLEKRPEQRFHSAHDIAFDLRALSEVSGPRPTSAPNAPVMKGRAVSAAALLLLGIGAGVLADRALRRSPTVESPTYRRLTFDRGTTDRARFAPDGHTVVYSASWRGEPSEVFTTRLDGRESRPLGLAGRLHAVSSTSELAVGLGVGIGPAPAVTLARMPLAGGAPREVLENVTWSDWSPDGAELAVVRVREGIQRVEFPIGRVLYETNDNITNLRVSPRGDWLAFVQNLAGSTFAAGSLVAVDRSGAKRVLSRDWTDLWGLAWRPDGRELWFTAGGRGELKALRAVTLDGKERLVARMLGQIDLEDIARDGRVLLTHPDFRFEMMALAPGASKERDLTWLGLSALADLSVDGGRVLFTELAQGGGAGGFSYLRKTDGSPPVRLGEGTALGLSPDGRWALCMLTAPSRLVLLPTGVGEARSLTRPGLSYLWWGAWFPDSRRVLFMAQANGGSPHAYVQDIEGGEPRSIGPGGIERAIAAPDGRTVAALAQDGKPVLFSIDDGETRPCPGLGSGDLPIRWSNDGRALFFQRQRGFTAEVHRLEVATGRRKLLSELVVRDLAGASPPGAGPSYGVRLTPDGKSYAYSFARNLSELYLVEGLK